MAEQQQKKFRTLTEIFPLLKGKYVIIQIINAKKEQETIEGNLNATGAGMIIIDNKRVFKPDTPIVEILQIGGRDNSSDLCEKCEFCEGVYKEDCYLRKGM